MNRLFIHRPLFRLLSPLCSGTLVYLLILLINNDIGQLQEAFLGEELYVCVGLAYLIQEYARLSLLWFERLSRPTAFLSRLVLQILSSVVICMVLVTGAMYLYFTYVLSYTPNFRELFIFNSIFSFITLIYLTLYLSHQYLYKINTDRVAKEIALKEEVQADFISYKKAINPDLLFESLEALLVLMKKDPEKAEALSDHFSRVYRYVLAKKNRELVPIAEELELLREWSFLFERLPYRNIRLGRPSVGETWVLPGSLLSIVERIVRSTISSDLGSLTVEIFDNPETLFLKYRHEEVLRGGFTTTDLKDIAQSYRVYTDRPIQVVEEDHHKIVELPKLNFDESSHN